MRLRKRLNYTDWQNFNLLLDLDYYSYDIYHTFLQLLQSHLKQLREGTDPILKIYQNCSSWNASFVVQVSDLGYMSILRKLLIILDCVMVVLAFYILSVICILKKKTSNKLYSNRYLTFSSCLLTNVWLIYTIAEMLPFVEESLN